MKRQKWLTGILAVMLVASFLLAAMVFVSPVVALADGGPGEPEPEVIPITATGLHFECNGILRFSGQ